MKVKFFILLFLLVLIDFSLQAQLISDNSAGSGEQSNSKCFANQKTGYWVGHNGSILKTTDGGSNWDEQKSGIAHDLYSVYFINEYDGYAVGEYGIIIKTSDGGRSWNMSYSNVN